MEELCADGCVGGREGNHPGASSGVSLCEMRVPETGRGREGFAPGVQPPTAPTAQLGHGLMQSNEVPEVTC